MFEKGTMADAVAGTAADTAAGTKDNVTEGATVAPNAEKAIGLSARPVERSGPRPVVGVMCCNSVVDGRPSQAVASRFLQPLYAIAGVAVVLVPALPDAVDIGHMAGMLDGLLLTGSASNVAPGRYGPVPDKPGFLLDRGRDEVALRLAARMIDAGRPVFGICRGFQELNVLFGGTLSPTAGQHGHYHPAGDGADLADLFGYTHDVDVRPGGVLSRWVTPGRHRVNSVHHQGIERLGGGLQVEAVAPGDRLVEAISARPNGGQILGVQWHPEWNVMQRPDDMGFFRCLGEEARAG